MSPTPALRRPDVADRAPIGVDAKIGEQEILLFAPPRSGERSDPAALSEWLSVRLAGFRFPRYSNAKNI